MREWLYREGCPWPPSTARLSVCKLGVSTRQGIDWALRADATAAQKNDLAACKALAQSSPTLFFVAQLTHVHCDSYT